MIKTYNLTRRHVGDDLASIVIAYIMPEYMHWDDIVSSGAGELVEMLHPEDYDVAYMHLAGDNEIELAKVVLRLDGGKTISEQDVKMHTQQGLENALLNAVLIGDIDRTKAAIIAGAREFNNACRYFIGDVDDPSARLVMWCADEWSREDDDVILVGCKAEW